MTSSLAPFRVVSNRPFKGMTINIPASLKKLKSGKVRIRALSEGSLVKAGALSLALGDNFSSKTEADNKEDTLYLTGSPISDEPSTPSTHVHTPVTPISLSSLSQGFPAGLGDMETEDMAVDKSFRDFPSKSRLALRTLLAVANTLNLPYVQCISGPASLILDYIDVSSCLIKGSVRVSFNISSLRRVLSRIRDVLLNLHMWFTSY